jgi:hypothetical protein
MKVKELIIKLLHCNQAHDVKVMRQATDGWYEDIDISQVLELQFKDGAKYIGLYIGDVSDLIAKGGGDPSDVNVPPKGAQGR